MATVMTKYTHAQKLFVDGSLDWDTDDFYLRLVDSGYTFNAAHTQWSDASTNEVAAGGGYTAGGEALTNKTVTNTKLDADDVTISQLTKTFRSGIICADKVVGGLTDPVVLHILYDDTAGGTDVSIAGLDFVTIWHVNGLITLG